MLFFLDGARIVNIGSAGGRPPFSCQSDMPSPGFTCRRTHLMKEPIRQPATAQENLGVTGSCVPSKSELQAQIGGE